MDPMQSGIPGSFTMTTTTFTQTPYGAGFQQGLASARLQNPMGMGMDPSQMMGMNPALSAQSLAPLLQQQQMFNSTLMQMMMMLMMLMLNGKGQQQAQQQQGSGAAAGGGGSDGGGGASGTGGTGGGSDVSTPNADPNTQIPSSGPNPNKSQVNDMLEAAAQKYGIPPDILKAIAWKESGWNANARGDGGASYGMMQIYTRAHPDYNVQRGIQDPSYNIEYGARLLRSLYDRYHDWGQAVKHYNGSGPMADRYQASVMGSLQSRPWAR